jgi:hypothetical protein
MQINKQGQLKIQEFKEINNSQASIKKANENQEEEFDAKEFYEY